MSHASWFRFHLSFIHHHSQDCNGTPLANAAKQIRISLKDLLFNIPADLHRCSAEKPSLPVKNIETHVDKEAVLSCKPSSASSGVLWAHLQDSSINEIAIDGQLNDDFIGNYMVGHNPDEGVHQLTIGNMTFEHGGIYVCIEDSGKGRPHFIVLDLPGKSRFPISFVYCYYHTA